MFFVLKVETRKVVTASGQLPILRKESKKFQPFNYMGLLSLYVTLCSVPDNTFKFCKHVYYL